MSAPAGFPFPLEGTDPYALQSHGRRGTLPHRSSAISPADDSDAFSPGFSPCDQPAGLLPSIASPPASVMSISRLSFDSPRDLRSSSALHTYRLPADPAFTAAVPSPFAENPTPPLESITRLRLPSFNSLGIANPHPDVLPTSEKIKLVPVSDPTSPYYGAEPVYNPSLALSDVRGEDGSNPKACNPPQVPQCGILDLALLTPPEEPTQFNWHRSILGERKLSEGGAADVPPPVQSMQPDADEAARPFISTEVEGTTDQGPSSSSQDVLEEAIEQILKNMALNLFPTPALKVLSHALPSPSIPGHCFPHVIERISEQLPMNPITWINLLHAVPGRFNLADLPVSPPSTPGVALGGQNVTEDYFTCRQFESAMPSFDYSAGDTVQSVKEHPLSPPSSVHLSIVERYIPPTSSNEYKDLFSISRPSLLVDRLVELVPGTGHLLFIYPTQRGAQTFSNSYLGPVLDPLLRQMVVINNFTADLSHAIGSMEATRELPDFGTMRRRIETLCADLSSAANPGVLARLHRQATPFALQYARPHRVRLERRTWASWWVKQEKARVRTAVTAHFRVAHERGSGASNGLVLPTAVIQEILEGVESRPIVEAEGDDVAIEVGVFVVGRGASGGEG